jgi:isochorismate pyruvate lyase
MKTPHECANMADIRTEIDAIDHQVVQLVAQRAQYVSRAAAFKTSEAAVRDDERVRAVIQSKKQLAVQYGVAPELIEALYTTMINYFVEKELEEWKARMGASK